MLPWVKGCWGGVPLTLGSRGWRRVRASRPPLRLSGCPRRGSLRHCLGTPAIEVCRGGQCGPPPSALDTRVVPSWCLNGCQYRRSQQPSSRGPAASGSPGCRVLTAGFPPGVVGVWLIPGVRCACTASVDPRHFPPAVALSLGSAFGLQFHGGILGILLW